MDNEPLIWWLTKDDLELLKPVPTILPEWLKVELRSSFGRAGRGRIWVSPELPQLSLEAKPLRDLSLLYQHTYKCAGIVITKDILPLLTHLPGLVTNFRYERHA